MVNKAPTVVTRLDQREIDAKVRELEKLELSHVRLAISMARDQKHRFVELESRPGIYSIFVDAVNQAANEAHVRDVRFHSYWRSYVHNVKSEGGRVTLILDVAEGD